MYIYIYTRKFPPPIIKFFPSSKTWRQEEFKGSRTQYDWSYSGEILQASRAWALWDERLKGLGFRV